jgi:hypothetical protein
LRPLLRATRDVFSSIAELYRMRWEVELFFRGWKGALRLDEIKRLQHPVSLDAAITASLLAATLAQKITVAVNELERRAADEAEAISPWFTSGSMNNFYQASSSA